MAIIRNLVCSDMPLHIGVFLLRKAYIPMRHYKYVHGGLQLMEMKTTDGFEQKNFCLTVNHDVIEILLSSD